ncbi:chromosomal replication initiator protein DnaA [Candidatus Saccharibacteria bacterium]|nr:chromosomal replication initiator protein DnaA [Candidatus Saccharibacteria bacterium]
MPNEWQSVLDEIKNNVSEMAYEAYFVRFNFVSNENDTLIASVPNVFIKAQIEGKYHNAVLDALKSSKYKFKDFKVIIDNKDNKTTVKRAVEITPDNTPVSTFSKKIIIPTPNYDSKRLSSDGNGLNPKFRLSNYVVGSNNDLAVSAAHAVIENPGMRYNPYFIYGGPGLGKTHLIQAIGNEILARNPDMNVLYVTIEQFYHEFVEAMRKKLDGFSEKYRKVDVLIIDDFQFIANKEKSQDEFFHTFNELQQHDKQIIVASDRLPAQIATIDERLASRLMMGVPIDIQMPDFETRCAILKSKAELLGAEIDDKTVEFIAENVRNNIRDLEGKLNQILALAELRGVPAYELIDDSYITQSNIQTKRKTISVKQLIDKVAKYYNLSSKDLLGTSRIKNIKTARQISMYLMKEELGLSTVEIGRELSKDHTTIMHGIKVIKNNLKTDFNLREQITDLRQKIYTS